MPNAATARVKRRWKVGLSRAPITVAAEAATISHRKSPTAAPPALSDRLRSIRFARIGAWKELAVRDTSRRTLKSESETAIRRVRTPAMRTEYARVPTRL